MTERFEENIGRYPYVTLAEVKNYLTISSDTYDGQLTNAIAYATAVIEHAIGYEVLANDYVEIFDGGTPSVSVSRLPLNNVYQIEEFNGEDYDILADTTTVGTPVDSSGSGATFSFINSPYMNPKIKKFGKSSLKLTTSDAIQSSTIPEELELEDGSFTIETFIRVDEATLVDNSVFRINTDASNYLDFGLANQYGLYITANVSGSATTIQGANTSIESQQFTKKRWAHIAASYDVDSETMYLLFNGNVVNSSTYAVSNHTYTANVVIGETFKGHIDEVRVSDIARYTSAFTPPTQRFRPDNDTVMLIHFDGDKDDTTIKDVHNEASGYSFRKDTGIIRKKVTSRELSVIPALSFNSYNAGVRVSYRAGYESNAVPKDLSLVTLDLIKMIWKQDQDRSKFSFEGESKEHFRLSSNFPPHIRRVVDLYRII